MNKVGLIIFLPLSLHIFVPRVSAQAQKPPVKKLQDSADNEETIEFDGFKTKKSYFIRQAKAKTEQLQSYLNMLIEKKDPNPKKVIDLTMGLFNNNEDVIVTITSTKSPTPVTKPIRNYLTKISQLPYSKIEVKYSNYQVVGKIHKAPDGTYRGQVVMSQEFTAYDAEGKAVYKDVVERHVEFILKIALVDKGDEKYYRTELFFGNMGITETKI